MSLTVNPETITAKLRLAPNFSVAASTQKEVATSIEDRLRQLDIQNILKESSTPPKKDKFKVTVLRDGTILKSQEGTKTQKLGTMDATALFNKFHLNPMPTSPSSDHDSYEVHTSPAKQDANSATASQDTGSLTIQTSPNGPIQNPDNSPSSYEVHTSPGQLINPGFLEIHTSPPIIPSNPTNSITAHTNPLNQSRRGQPQDNDSNFDDGRGHQQESFIVNTSPLSRSNQPQTFATIQTSPLNTREALLPQTPAHQQFILPSANDLNSLPLRPNTLTVPTSPPTQNTFSSNTPSRPVQQLPPRHQQKEDGRNSSHSDSNDHGASKQPYQQILNSPSPTQTPSNQLSMHLPYGDNHPLLTKYFTIMMNRSSSEDLLFLLQQSFDACNKELITKDTLINFLKEIEKTHNDPGSFFQLEQKLNYAIATSVISMYSELRQRLNTDKKHLSNLENLMLKLLNLLFEAHASNAISSETLAEHLLHVKNCTAFNLSDEEVANHLIKLLQQITASDNASTFVETTTTKDSSTQTLSAPPYKHPPAYDQLQATNTRRPHIVSEQPISKAQFHNHLMDIIAPIQDTHIYHELSDYITSQLETPTQSFEQLKNTVIAKVRAHLTTISTPKTQKPHSDSDTQTDFKIGSKPYRDKFRSVNFGLPDDENGFLNHYLQILKNPQQLEKSNENRLLLNLLQKLFNAYEDEFIPASILFNLLTTMSKLAINEDNFTYLNDLLIDEISKTILLRKDLFKEAASLDDKITYTRTFETQTDHEIRATSPILSDLSMSSFSSTKSSLTAQTQTDPVSEPSLSKQQMKTLLLGIISVIEHQQLHTSLLLYIDSVLNVDNPDYEKLKNRIIHEIKTYYTMPLSRRKHIRALTNIIAPIAHLPDEYATLSNVIRTELNKPNIDFEQLESMISEHVKTIVKERTIPKVSTTQQTQTSIIEPTDVHVQYPLNTSVDSSHVFATEQEHRDYLATLTEPLTPLEQARKEYAELKKQTEKAPPSTEKKYYLDLYKFLDTPVAKHLEHLPNLLLNMIDSATLDTEEQKSAFLKKMQTTYPGFYQIKSAKSQEKPLSSKAMTPPTGVNNNTTVDELPTQVVSSNPPSFSQEVRNINSRAAIKFDVLDGKNPKITNLEYCLLQYTKNPNATTRLTISEEIVNRRKNQESDADIFTALSAKYPDCFPIKPSNP